VTTSHFLGEITIFSFKNKLPKTIRLGGAGGGGGLVLGLFIGYYFNILMVLYKSVAN
jgi:hypothetical protein